MNMTKDDTSFFCVCAQFSLLFLLGIPLHLNRHIKWDRMTKRICCYGDVQSIFVAFGIVIYGWNLIGIEMKGTNKNVRGKKQPRDTTKFFAIELSQTIVDQMRAKKKEKNQFFCCCRCRCCCCWILSSMKNIPNNFQFSEIFYNKTLTEWYYHVLLLYNMRVYLASLITMWSPSIRIPSCK